MTLVIMYKKHPGCLLYVVAFLVVAYIVLMWSLAFSVRQKDLAKDVTICGDVLLSIFKSRHPDNTDDPQDVGLSSDDKATGMAEEIGIARRITVSHPERSV